MRMQAPLLAALAFFAGSVAAITASAGNLSFLDRSPLAYFSADDVELMRANALQVLDAPGPGAKHSWSNAKTGASGVAQVRGQFTATDGASCKRLRVLNKARGLESDATYAVCKYADRGWVLNTDATPAK